MQSTNAGIETLESDKLVSGKMMGDELVESEADVDARRMGELMPVASFKAHWHIFVPTIVICVLYISGWIILYFMGKSEGSLARLFIVVLAVGVPILFAHAFLRYQTISIEVLKTHLQYHPGWPRAEPVILPYALIDKIDFSRGLSGRMFGGGTVILQLVAGEAVGIADVEDPALAVAEISAFM